MIIKQSIPVNISINRFDGKGQVTLEPDVELEVDDATGAYLLNMIAFDFSGALATDFIKTTD